MNHFKQNVDSHKTFDQEINEKRELQNSENEFRNHQKIFKKEENEDKKSIYKRK